MQVDKRRVYYLNHYNVETFPFVLERLRQAGYEAESLFQPTSHGEYANALLAAWTTVRRLRRDDILVVYLCSTAVLCWWVSVLLHKPIRILSCGFALRNDASLQTRLMTFLYRHACRSPRFRITVNSAPYGRLLEQRLGLSEGRLPLLHDYGQWPGYERDYADNGKRIFFGGGTHRDWDDAIRLARELPDWHVMLVGYDASQRQEPLPHNVKAIRRLPFRQFVLNMRAATVVYVSVKYAIPAGLIVMMEAAWEGKLIAARTNAALDEYVTPDHGLVAHDAAEAARLISECYAHPDRCAAKVRAMQQFLHQECSKERYADRIVELVNDF